MRSRQEWLQIEGRRLALWSKCPPSNLLLVGCCGAAFLVQEAKFMVQEGSEVSTC
jgi:hypothetical protein